MWIWTLLACTCRTEPPPPPARWSEVEALAALDACGPEEAPLDSREALHAWHQADPEALTRLSAFPLFEVLRADLHTFTPDELEAAAHAVHSLERCGALVDHMVALTVGRLLCDSVPRGWSQAYGRYGAPPPLQTVAAREALSSYELARPVGEDGRFGRGQLEDLGEVLQSWVLDHPDAAPAPVEDPLRPVVGMITLGLDHSWADLIAERAALTECLDQPQPAFDLTEVDADGLAGAACDVALADTDVIVLVDLGEAARLGVDGATVELDAADVFPREHYAGGGFEIDLSLEAWEEGRPTRSGTLTVKDGRGTVTASVQVSCGS